MQHPDFSVIVPTYNRSDQLARCIESILKQKEKNFELIIVDDGSTDNTAQVVKNFLSDHRVKYMFQQNCERGAARNTGGNVAIGTYLNFFDSDDYMYENHLQAARAFLTKTEEVKFFHTCYRVVDENGNVILEERGEIDDVAAKRLIETNYLSCDSVFVKRTLFLQNQFNEDRRLASAEDWELWLRLVSREKLHRCEEITFEIRNHAGRSLFNIPAERIAERDFVLLDSLLRDQPFRDKFSRAINLFTADLYSFSALVFSVSKKGKSKAVHFLMKSFLASFRVLGRKRFWATAKHIVTKRL